MKKLLYVAALSLLVSPAWADSFVNGGFESGDFTGWTQDGGRYNWGGSYSYTGDPGKSAVVSAGLDPYTGNNLNMVYSGNYSARVNNYDWNYHFSTISQTVNDWSDTSIYFAYAAVLEDPGHAYAGHMRVSLFDETTGNYLYDTYFDYYTADTVLGAAQWNTYGNWGYTNWQVVQLDTSAVQGHDLTLTLLASDCGAGGHGGYAYLDGFGAAPPPPGVPEPTTMLLFGTGLAGLAAVGRRRARK